MIGNDWDIVLKDEYNKDYFIKLMNYINNEYQKYEIYPKKDSIFKAFSLTPYNNVKVVIIGQDPYHGENEANGLCFSVNNGIVIPPSLRNIFKELYEDLNIKRTNTDLSDWSLEGILLLNSILTVKKDTPLSHKNIGWEIFTDNVIKKLNERDKSIIFVLWGNYAKEKSKLITNKNHIIITSAHPSPLSYTRGFKGSKPFSKINNYLDLNGIEKIKW